MTFRLLIIGGYGNFGQHICRRLHRESGITLIIAGRNIDKAQAFAKTLTPTHPIETETIDIHKNLSEALSHIKPDLVIHTSGPYQGQDYHVARACIKQGCHYIDLADAREFVASIDVLDAAAKENNCLIISGASSVPCLTSALIDHYSPMFKEVTQAYYGISTTQKNNRGQATTEAILSYTGHAFNTVSDGKNTQIYGWQGLKRRSFWKLGKRWLSDCDIPDLTLFRQRYPNLQTIEFKAGLEISILHLGLWALSYLRRWRLLPRLDRFAPAMMYIANFFDRFGSEKSGFYMRLSGTDFENSPKTIEFDLVARSGHGPFIPAMPAVILAKKLAQKQIKERGATACMGLVTRDEYLDILADLDIEWKETL